MPEFNLSTLKKAAPFNCLSDRHYHIAAFYCHSLILIVLWIESSICILTEDGKVTGIVFKKCTSVRISLGPQPPIILIPSDSAVSISSGSAGMVIILLLTRLHIRQQSRISLSVVMYIQVLNSLLMLLRQVSRGLYLFTDMYSHTAHLQLAGILTIMLNLIRMITALRSMTIQAVSAQLRSQELISCHSEVMQVYSQRNRLRKKLQDAWAVVQNR